MDVVCKVFGAVGFVVLFGVIHYRNFYAPNVWEKLPRDKKGS